MRAGTIGLLFCSFVLLSAVRIGTADWLYGNAKDELASAFPQSSLAEAARTLQMAGRLSPDNPDRHEGLARLALMRAWRPETADAERADVLRSGLASIRRAIVLRPVSAYSWAIELQLKSELREYDEEFRRALQMTAKLGPWEPELQRVVVAAGLAAWPALPDAEQGMIMGSLLRGMKRQPSTMLAIAKQRAPGCLRDDCLK